MNADDGYVDCEYVPADLSVSVEDAPDPVSVFMEKDLLAPAREH